MIEDFERSTGLRLSQDDLENWGRDWTRFHRVNAMGVVFPKNTEEVARVLSFSHSHNLKVVPSGGRTGLAAGAVATKGELILSLSKMNKILEWDPLSLSIHVEAGVIHQDLQEYLRPLGYQWPVDLASKGSCQIGGNLATNAGGLRVIRYGHARRWVQSIEVVLADGRILELNGPLEKNNAGLCLRDLVIGSEGTLAVITKARLKVAPLSEKRVSLLLPLSSTEEALEVLKQLRTNRISVLAFEYFQANCLARVLEQSSLVPPFCEEFKSLVLMDLEIKGVDEILSVLNLPDQSVLADSEEKIRKLWAYRESITEALSRIGFVYKQDIALPIGAIPEFLAMVEKDFPNRFPGAELYVFGHLGDGNLHLNVVFPGVQNTTERLALCESQNDWLYAELRKRKGSISAEHGLGLLKQAYLHFAKDESELELARAIRNVFDPKAILNPGKGI